MNKRKPEACFSLSDPEADDGSVGRAIGGIIDFAVGVVKYEGRQIKDK